MSNGTLMASRLINVDQLKPHSRNSDIYGDPRDSQDFPAFVQDVKENGIHPLIVADDMTIIGGHRRYYAALELGVTQLHVTVFHYETETDKLAALIADNNVRAKSNWQLANEAKELGTIERERAKQRQGTRTDLENDICDTGHTSSSNGRATDAIGKQLDISGRKVDDLLTAKKVIDELEESGKEDEAEQLRQKLNQNARKAAQDARKKQYQQTPPKPQIKDFVTLAEWQQMTEAQRLAELSKTSKTIQFNQTNDNVEWALWTWNPITGCLHGCDYCYARDIANRFYTHLEENKRFAPVFYPERLSAPANTRQPDLTKIENPAERMGKKNVFTCSMADLFGKWVPAEWINAILEQVKNNPQWNFLFLTKFPQRMAEFDYPPNAWLGTTVDKQWAVDRAEKAFRKLKASGYEGIAWLSCEPMLERLTFTSLEMFNWVVIGGSSKSTQTPEYRPPFDDIVHLYNQARRANCMVYMKTNLLPGISNEQRLREYPIKE